MISLKEDAQKFYNNQFWAQISKDADLDGLIFSYKSDY